MSSVWPGLEGYIVGLGRDVPHPYLSHVYKGDVNDPGWPMCRRGWNREDGRSYSIWRENVGKSGVCKVCLAQVAKGRNPVPPKALT